MKNAMKELVFGKIEVTYNTDPVPTVANAILVSNVSHGPLVGDAKPRQRAHPNFGADAQVLAQQHRTLSFDFEMAGSGAAGTAPLWGVVMRACSHTETITASTKVEYAPVTPDDTHGESGTFYYFLDGLRHKLTGAKGTITANIQGGDLPTFHAELTGFYSPVTDTPFPTGWASVLSSFVPNIEVNDTNTQFTLFGFATVLEQLQFTQGNTVAFARRANRGGTDITNRASTGSVSVETPKISDIDYVGIASTMPPQLGALQLVLGTVAGNIVQLDAAQTQLMVPTYGKRGDVSLLQIPLGFTRNAGDDEYKWTVK